MILALAAEQHGRAYAQWKGIGAGFDRKTKGRKSTQLRRAIFNVGREIHRNMALYAGGPCVKKTPYE